MSKKIYIYENLPSGGAKNLYFKHRKYLSKHFIVEHITDKFKPKNLANYLVGSTIYLSWKHKKTSNNLNSKYIFIAYHSWLTKSPHILRFFTGKKAYICQEPMREYYDKQHISKQSIKEKTINILRLPIKWLDRKNVQSADLIISNSRFSQKAIQSAYGKKSTIVYPGVDLEKYLTQPIIKKNQVISVGSINKLKRFDFIIKTLSNISEKHRPKLLIVGNGFDKKYKHKLEKDSRDKNVKLKILVNISSNQLRKEYLQSKLFIYAPINEPFGIVVLEAMVNGLPVVSYRRGGGYAEILSNKNGALIENLNAEHWAKQITELLIDKKKIKKIGEKNRQYVKEFSMEKMNKQIYKLIKSL